MCSCRLNLTTAEYEDIFKKINGWATVLWVNIITFVPQSVTVLTVWCLFSLIFIGGAADLETSDFAKVAKIFYGLALKVCSVIHWFHCCYLKSLWWSAHRRHPPLVSSWYLFLATSFRANNHTFNSISFTLHWIYCMQMWKMHTPLGRSDNRQPAASHLYLHFHCSAVGSDHKNC